MILYHVTNRRNLASILEKGLMPAGGDNGFTTRHGKRESVLFFETRPIPAQPGEFVFLRIETDRTDGAFWQLSELVPYHGTPDFGYVVPPDWRVTLDTLPPQAIEAIADPPRNDAAHLAAFIQGADLAQAQGALATALIAPARASAWRSVRRFQHRARFCPWHSNIDLATRIEWVFARRSVLDVFYDALQHVVTGLHARVGDDPHWAATWADYATWFTAGRNAANRALAYQDVAA